MTPYLRKKVQFSFDECPTDTCFEAGYLVSKNADWRLVTPVIDHEKCVNCKQCYLYCPDGAMKLSELGVDIDYDFCKGCGICKKICAKNAIEMEVRR